MKFFNIIALVFLIIAGGAFSQEEDTELYDETGEDSSTALGGSSGGVGGGIDEEDGQQQEQIFITSSPFVHTSSLFPRYPDGRVPLGKVVEILLGFKNFGQKAFNVTLIHGSLRYTQDPSIFIQNFSSWRGGAVVKPGQHITFQYFFLPDELLEPKDYVLVVNSYYTDEDNINYTSAFYNGTIVIYEVGLVFDLPTVILTLFLTAFFGAVGYFAYITALGKGKKLLSVVSSSSSREKGAAGGVVSANTDEYLKGNDVVAFKKQTKPKSPGKK